MAKLVEYTVVREHQGDKITDEGTEVHFYKEGDTRLAQPSVVAELVKSGVLAAPDAEKAEPSHEDKSEGAAPENKAETGRAAKAKAKDD